jgi:hypothetical protein
MGLRVVEERVYVRMIVVEIGGYPLGQVEVDHLRKLFSAD